MESNHWLSARDTWALNAKKDIFDKKIENEDVIIKQRIALISPNIKDLALLKFLI